MSKPKDYKWGYITPQGDFAIAPTFDGASNFNDGLAAVKVDWARGYINHAGDFVVKPIFEAAGDFHDGVAVVKLDGAERCIDKNGVILDDVPASPTLSPQIESGYDPHYQLHDGLARFVENGKFGYKDAAGNVIIKPQFVDADDFSEGLACVKKAKTSSWGYIDTAGRMSIPANFRQAKPFHEGLAAVLIGID